MYLGVDYYPEQWDRSLIDADLDNIAELGCNIIRIGDFAWDVMEREEGQYDFSLFDEVIEKAAKRGIKTMICVPSATMPAWLYQKYPEIMAEDQYGHSQPYGGRRGYCYNSDIYLEKVLTLTKKMALHFHNNKNIVAWQLDNEIGHEGSDMCYCEKCHQKFIDYLKEKYHSIEELNKRWGTSFWAQSYNSFEQINIPKTAYTAQNPSERMEWERFRSYSIEQYLKKMYDTIKTIIPNSVVLHDFEGGCLEKHFNVFEVSKNLDEIAYNNYPVWGGTVEPLKPWEVALALDEARGFKGQNFWITEEIMGAQGHDVIGCCIKPKQGSTWAIQALAHGCKSFLIFRYRGFNKGAEQYCYGILDADNRKKAKYYEVKDLYKYIKENEDVFSQEINAKCAIVYDYDSASAFRIQKQCDCFDYHKEIVNFYKQLWMRDLSVDVITWENDIDKYDLIVVPYMIIMKEQFKQKLKDAAAKGKTIVLTARSSWKDEDNNLVFGQDLPVGLTDLTGIVVDGNESLLQNSYRTIKNGNKLAKGYKFADLCLPTTAEIIYGYQDDYLQGYCAISKNHFGKGTCYYLGTILEEEAMNELFDEITGKRINKKENEETIKRGDKIIKLNYSEFSYIIRNMEDYSEK